jgi:valyl-tRNA synthetase
VDEHNRFIVGLAKLGRLTINPTERPVHTHSGSIILSGEHKVDLLMIPLAETMETAKEHAQETAKREKRLKELATQIERDEKALANAQFLSKAPPNEVEKIKTRHQEFRLERESLIEELARVNKQKRGTT